MFEKGVADKLIIDVRIRRKQNIQYDDIQLKNMVEIILQDSDILFCIYKDDKFFASIDQQRLCTFSTNEEIRDYLNIESVHEWINGLDMGVVNKLFMNYKNETTIIIQDPDVSKREIFTVNRVDMVYIENKIDFVVYKKLIEKKIMTCVVNFPLIIRNVYGAYCSTTLTEQWLRDSSTREMFKNDIKRITDYTDHEYVVKVLDRLINIAQEKQVVGEKSRTIFLVGPCIVLGYSPAEKSMAEFLSTLLEKFNYPYNIVKINSRYFPKKLLEYDICQNDIVIFFGTNLQYKDYDLTEDYEKYSGPKNLCTNATMHVSDVGCELIANSIMNDIIVKHDNMIEDVKADKKILHFAEKDQLYCGDEYEIYKYLKRTNISKHKRNGNNGAIVMNANPFTIGHRKLVEYASCRVDWLFVFVVEEDSSFFTYKERLEMIQQGTKDIDNVVVLGSGNFVISNKTFYDYFTKEADNEKIIDASQDIYIFARYIAPYFNIYKRFVGDEPVDNITNQYNKQMKKILPDYGCELVEIQRFKKGGSIVSGSMVRKALHSDDVGYLHSMLPKTSFNYIQENMKKFKNRDNNLQRQENYQICMTDRMLCIWELLELIKKEKYIVIYGIGNDTRKCLELLDWNEKDKLVFVDKKAENEKIYFMGKEVLVPSELNKVYLKYKIVVLSSKYYKQIYNECIKLGVDKERIKFNPYNLYLVTQRD